MRQSTAEIIIQRESNVKGRVEEKTTTEESREEMVEEKMKLSIDYISNISD